MSVGDRVSLCMIVRDEEEFLADCLKSVQGAVDEIIIVDTGSTDSTAEIAESFGAKMLSYEWNDDYSSARNVSIDAATGDWILVLDADERLDANGIAAIRKASKDSRFDAYMFDQLNYCSDIAADVITNSTCRMWKNRPNYRYNGRVHENVTAIISDSGGAIGTLDAAVHHLGAKKEIVAARKKSERYIRILESELADNPTDARRLHELAISHYVNDRFDESISILEKATDYVNPESNVAGWIYNTLAGAYCRVGKPVKAIQAAARAESLNIRHPEISYACGQAYMALGNHTEATEAFTRAIVLGKFGSWVGDKATWGWKAREGVALCLLRLNNWSGAAKLGRKVLKENPEAASTHALLADAYMNMGELAKAGKHFKTLTDLHPQDSSAWIGYGRYYTQMGKPEDALECYIKAAEISPNNPEAYFCAGDVLYNAHQYTAAADAYSNALLMRPMHAPGFLTLGNCYARMGAFEAAAMSYRQALEIDPKFLDAMNNLEYAEDAIRHKQAA